MKSLIHNVNLQKLDADGRGKHDWAYSHEYLLKGEEKSTSH